VLTRRQGKWHGCLDSELSSFTLTLLKSTRQSSGKSSNALFKISIHSFFLYYCCSVYSCFMKRFFGLYCRPWPNDFSPLLFHHDSNLLDFRVVTTDRIFSTPARELCSTCSWSYFSSASICHITRLLHAGIQKLQKWADGKICAASDKNVGSPTVTVIT